MELDDLKKRKYLHATRKRFDPVALALSSCGLIGVTIAVGGIDAVDYFWDSRSFMIVIGGTFASILFQFDFSTTLNSLFYLAKSAMGTPEKPLLKVSKSLDDAILNQTEISELEIGEEITGNLLNDIVTMVNRGMSFDEIDELVTARVREEFFQRSQAVSVLDRAAIISPALGLFGTVMGLIGVLKNLSFPTQIGPSMSLALMTTAYGAGLASLVFTPLSGRLEHHNNVYLEIHRQILSKVAILIKRQERMPGEDAALELEIA